MRGEKKNFVRTLIYLNLLDGGTISLLKVEKLDFFF
jgi:hypothetical protein